MTPRILEMNSNTSKIPHKHSRANHSNSSMMIKCDDAATYYTQCNIMTQQ